MTTSKRDVRRTRGTGRLALLILGATVLVGVGAASPALAHHDRGPTVSVQTYFPFPFPFPVPVVHKTVYREPYRHFGHVHRHYRDFRDCDRRHVRKGHRHRHGHYKHHRRHARHERWDDRRDRRHDRRHDRRGGRGRRD